MQNKKIMPLCNDVMFKAVFGAPDSVKFVTYFLSSYFDIPYEELKGNVEILNPEVPSQILKSKKKTLDLKLKLNDDYVLVEMNCFNKNISLVRNLVYLMQEFGYQFNRKDDYKKIKKYHQINFCLYSYFKPEKEKFEVKLRDQYGNTYLEKMQSDFIDIAYCKKLLYNRTNLTKLERWILILMSETKEELERAIGDIMDKETKEEFVEVIGDLDKIEEIHEYFEKYEDRSNWDQMEKEIIMEQAKEEGLSQGIKQGIEQSKKEIVKNMLNMGFDIEKISLVTNLTIEDINNIK